MKRLWPFLCAAFAEASSVFRGSLQTTNSWQYVARFAFVPSDDLYGKIGFTVLGPRSSRVALHLYYMDSYADWRRVLSSRTTCTDRIITAQHHRRVDIFPLHALASSCCANSTS